jgi:hypothetical protein
MTDTNQQLIEAFDNRVERRNERRDFFKAAFGAAAVAGAGAAAVTLGGVATAQTLTDADVLNFALNLEYLEAQFYSYAVNGTGLPENLLDGTTPRGTLTPGKQVTFGNAAVQAYAREIAADEIAHVAFLRSQLGTAKVSMPSIDLGFAPTSAFSTAARSAGLVGAGVAFDPYENDNSFLLGAFLFADVGVTAYKGAAPLLTNPVFIEASAGILATEAYHAGLIRTSLYSRGLDTPSLRTSADAISDARDALDGTDDLDQGISPTGTGAAIASNLVPTNGDGLSYSRTTGQVLNIVYLTKAQATLGGFFPAGVNGTIKTSAASG